MVQLPVLRDHVPELDEFAAGHVRRGVHEKMRSCLLTRAPHYRSYFRELASVVGSMEYLPSMHQLQVHISRAWVRTAATCLILALATSTTVATEKNHGLGDM